MAQPKPTSWAELGAGYGIKEAASKAAVSSFGPTPPPPPKSPPQEKTYAPGSTMYEMGFRNEREYLDSQKFGVTYGTHEGKLIPEDSIIVDWHIQRGRTGSKRDEPIQLRYSGETKDTALGLFQLKLKQGEYKVPITATSEKGETTQRLISSKKAKELSKLQGEPQFEKLMAMGIIPAGSQYIQGEGKEWSYAPVWEIDRYEKELKEWQTERAKLDAEYKTQARIYESNQAAIVTLKPYTTDEGTDIAKFLRKNPKDAEVLINAGFSPRDVAKAREFNRQYLGIGSPDYIDKRTFAKDYFKDKEWQYTINRSSATAAELKQYDKRLKEASKAHDRKFTAPMSAGDFAKRYFDEKGWKWDIHRGTADVKEWRLHDARLREASESYKSKYGTKAIIKSGTIRVAEAIVPGVYVARHWAELDTKGKVINIAIDVASILLVVGIFKLSGIATRQLTGTTKAIRLAKKAGNAGRELSIAQKTYNSAQRTLKPNSKLLISHANKVAEAQVKSMKADRAFLENLQRINRIRTRDLKKLAKLTGLKNLDKAILSVTKAQKQVLKLWNKLDKMKFYPNAKTVKEVATNNRYLKVLSKLQKAQARLQAALSNAGSTLKPRYTYSPPADEFAGFKVAWGKTKPTIKSPKDETIKAIENYLARDKELKPKGPMFWEIQTSSVATKTKPKVTPKVKGKHELKLKATYTKAKTRPVTKPKVPESVFPGIKTRAKVTARIAAATIPAEALGRMTSAQIAKYYGTEEVLEAVSKTFIDQVAKVSGLEWIDPKTIEQIRQAVKPAIDTYAKALQQGKTSAEAKQSLEEAIKTRLMSSPLTKTQLGGVARVATKIIVKPLPLPLPPPKGKKPLKLRLPPGGSSDEDKRKRIRQSTGAVTWNMGKLGGKDVWHTRLDTGEHLIVLGQPPKGARILADGPGSAYKTTQRIGTRQPFGEITQQHGAVRATVASAATSKGASIRFTPLGRTDGLKSTKRGKIFYTPVRGSTLMSRRPLGRRRR